MRDDHFQTAEPLFVRMASVPRTHREQATDGPTPSGIRRTAADPLLREAIRVASDSLSDAVDRLDAGEDLTRKRLHGTALSVSRYALRLGGRPTPFGLFAGVTTARLGDTARVTVRGPGHKAARPDAGWLDARVREWLASPEVRRRVDVALNDLTRIRGDRLVLPGAEREISVRRNPLVAWLDEAAARPVPYARLLERAAAAFPDAGAERVDALLAQLIRHGILLTSITPLHIGAPLLDRIDTAVAGLPGAAVELRATRDALAAYEKTAPGEGGEAWQRLRRRIDPGGTARRPPVQVDLRMDADIQLPRSVVEEARRYASAMWTISEPWVTHAHMRDYRNRFLERYGTEGAVPLAELVDPHRGLGLPEGYRGRARHRSGAGGGPGRERRVLTAELVQEALLADDPELRLTPELIDRLAPPAEDPAPAPPRSLELCFQLLADSEGALDRGEFQLLSGPHSGSWVAGATAGRFAGLTGGTEGLSRLAAAIADEGTIAAQVEFQPRTVRALNMIQVPRLLPYRIPVGVYADPDDPGHLDWRELLVGADPSGMRLTHPRTGERVVPVVPHMLALDREAPAVVRLLVDIVFGRSRTWTGWEWCGVEALPHLPRVTYGRVVVSPRRWTADRRMREAAADPEAWEGAVRGWRGRYRVPDRVRVARWDQTYDIDLADPWHRSLLRHEVRKGDDEGALALFEDPTADGRGLGWAAGHSTEVVIPLLRRTASGRTAPAPTARKTTPAPPAASRTGRYHLPGEDWLYAKLYATADTHDELLATRLTALLRDLGPHLDRWFFLRYQDPDPHLRLRLHGDPLALRTHVLPELARHARALRDTGALRSLVLDSYEPETDRYGGPEALPPAERLFCLDSRSALAQLTMRARGGLGVPDEVLAAVNHAMLLESLGDWDWCAWVDHAFLKGPAHATYQRHRAPARDLIRPGAAAARFGEAFGAPALAALWTEDPAPREYGRLVLPAPQGKAPHENALLALLHMQHNRLFGIDRARETRGYAILRGVARDHLGRRAHLRDHDPTESG